MEDSEILKLMAGEKGFWREMYFRNNSTGNPTKVHFTKEDGNTFCGFKCPCAEHQILKDTSYLELNTCCERCLKSIEKITNHETI